MTHKPRVRVLTKNCEAYPVPSGAAARAALSRGADFDGPLYSLKEVNDMRIRPTRRKVWCRQVPREERSIWLPSDPDTALWRVLAVASDVTEVAPEDLVIIEPRAPAFETPSGRDDEAVFKIDDVRAAVE